MAKKAGKYLVVFSGHGGPRPNRTSREKNRRRPVETVSEVDETQHKPEFMGSGHVSDLELGVEPKQEK